MAAADVDGYQERLAVSTGAMVAVLFFFFPAFPFLMIYRIVQHRDYPYKKISDCQLIATILLIFSILWYIVAFGSGPSWKGVALVTIFLFIPSLWLYNKASSINHAIYERCVQYRDCIYVNGVTSIAELAKLTGQRARIVKNEVKHSINTGLLPDLETVGDRILRLDIKLDSSPAARFHENVIRVERVSPAHFTPPSRQASPPPPAPKPKTVQCHGCGATMTIMEGETKRCEYCDSIVS